MDVKQTEILTHVTHVNGWFTQLHESKLPFVSRIENIRSKLSIFLFMYLGSLSQLLRSRDRGHVRPTQP